jgi:hypothetical protein
MTQLDQSWAEHLIYNYQEEHDLILNKNHDISEILQKLMYEHGFECICENTFEDILDHLIRNYL